MLLLLPLSNAHKISHTRQQAMSGAILSAHRSLHFSGIGMVQPRQGKVDKKARRLSRDYERLRDYTLKIGIVHASPTSAPAFAPLPYSRVTAYLVEWDAGEGQD